MGKRLTGDRKNKGQAKMKKKIVKMHNGKLQQQGGKRAGGKRDGGKHVGGQGGKHHGRPNAGLSASGSSASVADAEESGGLGAPRIGGGMKYSAGLKTLLIGEGDFSFAAALAITFGECPSLCATAFDDEATLHNKYAAAAENIEMVRSLGGQVILGVDATRLAAGQAASVAVRRAAGKQGFDRIVFNFPHAGSGTKDQARNIAEHQALLRGFFCSVTSTSSLLAEQGEVHVTVKRGEPYDSWNVVVLAKLAGLRVRNCVDFVPSRYPGYAHRRTIGDDHAGDGEVTSGKTYAFIRPPTREEAEEVKAVRGKVLQTGQSYKEAWKQRHKKARRS